MAKKQHTMNVSLTPQLAKEVAERVKSGKYASASEVMRAALRVLQSEERQQRDDLRHVRQLLDKGLADAKAGRHAPASEVMAELRAGLARRRRRRAA